MQIWCWFLTMGSQCNELPNSDEVMTRRLGMIRDENMITWFSAFSKAPTTFSDEICRRKSKDPRRLGSPWVIEIVDNEWKRTTWICEVSEKKEISAGEWTFQKHSHWTRPSCSNWSKSWTYFFISMLAKFSN